TVTGAIAQTGGTALLLAVMQQRSFVVTTAYVKTEPVQVAIFGLIFLGDPVTPALALAIVVATGGGVLHSSPPRRPAGTFFLESSRAWTGLRGALCHCCHRLSRRHPRPRQPKLPGGCHHNPGPSPTFPTERSKLSESPKMAPSDPKVSTTSPGRNRQR